MLVRIKELKMRLTSTPILIVPERGLMYIVYYVTLKDKLRCILM